MNIEMKYNFNLEYFEKIADYVKSKIDFKPQTALILGSALGSLASDIKTPLRFLMRIFLTSWSAR